MAWTKAQQKVIDTRNKNLLVSAAAGSGKTAVLVERIISMISEGENPMDIDHLLVVTFTNAAAAEMRSRIGEAIDKKLLEQPGNLHLQKQISLLQSAQITTIHSFCLNVIRNYFHHIDLDPSFKIAEESEITLMKSDVISELLERWYEEGRDDFHAFIESYSYSKSDAPIEELIIQLYNFSMSAPWPKDWIEEKRRMFELATVEEMADAPWMKELMNYVKAVLADLQIKNEEALEICNETGGPSAYATALISDRNMLEMLTKADTYLEYTQSFTNISFDRLSTKKEEGVAQWKKDKVKEVREEVKKGIKDITGQFFFQSPQEMLLDLQAVGPVMQVLFDLTLEFIQEFSKKKEEKNLIDFNDLEHFALKILVKKQERTERDRHGEYAEYDEFSDHEKDEGYETYEEQDEHMAYAERDEYEEQDQHIEHVEREEYKEQDEHIEYAEREKSEEFEGNNDHVVISNNKVDTHNNRMLKVDLTNGDAIIPTVAAIELSELFDEILIDEYQDSNMVQETILKSISREEAGRPNRFMVGDVKQSIYKFRLAMPEIFMEKYENYSCEDSVGDGQVNNYQRIDLDRNFRSRKNVLDYVNRIFEQIMKKPVGGIVYDEAASLKYGELFEEILQKDDGKEPASEDVSEDILNRVACEVELMLVTEEDIASDDEEVRKESEGVINSSEYSGSTGQTDEGSEDTLDEEEAIYTKKEIEARLIARKIKELTDPVKGMLVFDRKLKKHRPAVFSDIVILLRSMTGWSEVFVNTLMQEGILAYADTGTGYFQTLEIMTMINMLRIIDNPRQDIPLAGTLYSPIGGITTTELAMIRASARNVSMYSALIIYSREGDDEQLRVKTAGFIEALDNYRLMVNHKPIHELIQTVLEQTGYYYYVSAMPGGERRKANLDMLVSQAVRFEKGTYTGLFHFIRYIEKLNKYEVDFGEASTSGEQDNTVRIMSIHKSKGLEFPVVFVAGMSKQFNNQDIRSSIVLHNELGVGPEYIDSKLRTKVPTLVKKVIQKKVQTENLGEELRVLYVAMTRAKEKLILTGYLKSQDEIRKKEFSFYEIMSAKSYLEWVLPAMVNRIGWTPDYVDQELVTKQSQMSIKLISKDTLLSRELVKQVFLRKDAEDLLKIEPEIIFDQSIKEEIKDRFNFEYPYRNEAGLKVKMSVSELKKLGQYEKDEPSVELIKSTGVNAVDKITFGSTAESEGAQVDLNTTVPDFISQKQSVLTGTDRGTLYHKVLELLDLNKATNSNELIPELERMVREGAIKGTDLEKLKLDYINRFVSSAVADRMRQAEAKHKLYKEQQFVMGVKASEINPDIDSDELILIQGIIDVFFEEDGELVLLDYKSDLVSDAEQLVKRYKVQLDYYRRALEQILNKRVKEMMIYSLPLGKEIRIDDHKMGTL